MNSFFFFFFLAPWVRRCGQGFPLGFGGFPAVFASDGVLEDPGLILLYFFPAFGEDWRRPHLLIFLWAGFHRHGKVFAQPKPFPVQADGVDEKPGFARLSSPKKVMFWGGLFVYSALLVQKIGVQASLLWVLDFWGGFPFESVDSWKP